MIRLPTILAVRHDRARGERADRHHLHARQRRVGAHRPRIHRRLAPRRHQPRLGQGELGAGRSARCCPASSRARASAPASASATISTSPKTSRASAPIADERALCRLAARLRPCSPAKMPTASTRGSSISASSAPRRRAERTGEVLPQRLQRPRDEWLGQPDRGSSRPARHRGSGRWRNLATSAAAGRPISRPPSASKPATVSLAAQAGLTLRLGVRSRRRLRRAARRLSRRLADAPQPAMAGPAISSPRSAAAIRPTMSSSTNPAETKAIPCAAAKPSPARPSRRSQPRRRPRLRLGAPHPRHD